MLQAWTRRLNGHSARIAHAERVCSWVDERDAGHEPGVVLEGEHPAKPDRDGVAVVVAVTGCEHVVGERVEHPERDHDEQQRVDDEVNIGGRDSDPADARAPVDEDRKAGKRSAARERPGDG